MMMMMLINCLEIKYVPFHVPFNYKCHPKFSDSPSLPLYNSVCDFIFIMSLSCHLVSCSARTVVLQSCIMFEHSMYQKSIPFPCSQVVVFLLIPPEAYLRFFERKFFSGVGSSPPRPTPNLEDQGVPFCLGHHL
jgi:hypothetical protein